MLLDSYISIIFGDHSIKTSSSISLFICVISYIFLSRLILGEKIYMHQIFSSIIIFISILVVIILYLIHTSNNKLLINIVFIIITSSLYALFNIMEKKYYNIFMDSPYHLMFIIGLFIYFSNVFIELLHNKISGGFFTSFSPGIFM